MLDLGIPFRLTWISKSHEPFRQIPVGSGNYGGKVIPRFTYEVIGKHMTDFYFIEEGTHPHWEILEGLISDVTEKKDTAFYGANKALQTDMDSYFFGELVSRWVVLLEKLIHLMKRKWLRR